MDVHILKRTAIEETTILTESYAALTIEIYICKVSNNYFKRMRSFYKGKKKAAKDMVESSKHISTFDTDSINQALNRAINDDKFINDTIKSIESMKFPSYQNAQNVISIFVKIGKLV